MLDGLVSGHVLDLWVITLSTCKRCSERFWSEMAEWTCWGGGVKICHLSPATLTSCRDSWHTSQHLMRWGQNVGNGDKPNKKSSSIWIHAESRLHNEHGVRFLIRLTWMNERVRRNLIFCETPSPDNYRTFFFRRFPPSVFSSAQLYRQIAIHSLLFPKDLRVKWWKWCQRAGGVGQMSVCAPSCNAPLADVMPFSYVTFWLSSSSTHLFFFFTTISPPPPQPVCDLPVCDLHVTAASPFQVMWN